MLKTLRGYLFGGKSEIEKRRSKFKKYNECNKIYKKIPRKRACAKLSVISASWTRHNKLYKHYFKQSNLRK